MKDLGITLTVSEVIPKGTFLLVTEEVGV